MGRSYGGGTLTVVKVKFQMVHIKCACHYFVQRNKNHLPVRTCQLLRQPLKLLGNPRMKRFFINFSYMMKNTLVLTFESLKQLKGGSIVPPVYPPWRRHRLGGRYKVGNNTSFRTRFNSAMIPSMIINVLISYYQIHI